MKFMFTFGVNHKLKSKYQPITAINESLARSAMFRVYGSNWSFCYSEEEFNQLKEQGRFLDLEPLETITTQEAV